MSRESGSADRFTHANLHGTPDRYIQNDQLHATLHQPGGGDAMVVDEAVVTGSLRTLGTGPLQAATGNHVHAGGNGGPIFVRKTGDTVNNLLLFTDATDLKFPVGGNTNCIFWFVAFFTTSADAVGIRFGVNGPLFSNVIVGAFTPTDVPSNAVGISEGVATGFDTATFATTSGPGGTISMAIVGGTLQTGNISGTLVLRFAPEPATAATILANSWGMLQEVA